MSTLEQLKSQIRSLSLPREFSKDSAKVFACQLTERTINTLKAHSNLRKVSAVSHLEPGEQARYTIGSALDGSIYVLPRAGMVPQNFIAMSGDEVYIPTFNITASVEWGLRNIEFERYDLVNKAIKQSIKQLIDYEDESLFRLLVPAACSHIDNTHEKSETITVPRNHSFNIKVVHSMINTFKEREACD